MRYMVLTARHHDGFCLFDSDVSGFTSSKTQCGRDLIAEFAEACRGGGMPFGFYYSLVDWRFPSVLPRSGRSPKDDFSGMVKQAHDQVRELCTKYGKLDILWYDMLDPHDPGMWRSKELEAMVRKLQPQVLINDRSGIPADFATPENVVAPREGPWESCYTINRTWGYARHDRNYKSTAEILRLLGSCVSQNGNLLLNVSPDGEGRIPPEQVQRLKQVGDWLRINGSSIYGAGPSPFGAPALGMATRSKDKVYLLVMRWPGSVVNFAWCGSVVRSARLLADGTEAIVKQTGDRVSLEGLPSDPADPYLNVIELSFEGEPRATDPPYQ
jgi:alpha-L-fucosidase